MNDAHCDIKIFEADLDSLDALVAWRIQVLREVFAMPADADMAQLRQANRKYYLHAIPSGSHIACLATDGSGHVAGSGGICIHENMPSPDNPSGRSAWLMNICVAPSQRGKGLGHSIVRWLIDRAHALGITEINLETSDCGRPLYLSMGFEQKPDILHCHES